MKLRRACCLSCWFLVSITCSRRVEPVCTSQPMISLQTVSLSGMYYERNLWSNVTAVGPCLDIDTADLRIRERFHLTLSIYKIHLGSAALEGQKYKGDICEDDTWNVSDVKTFWMCEIGMQKITPALRFTFSLLYLHLGNPYLFKLFKSKNLFRSHDWWMNIMLWKHIQKGTKNMATFQSKKT